MFNAFAGRVQRGDHAQALVTADLISRGYSIVPVGLEARYPNESDRISIRYLSDFDRNMRRIRYYPDLLATRGNETLLVDAKRNYSIERCSYFELLEMEREGNEVYFGLADSDDSQVHYIKPSRIIWEIPDRWSNPRGFPTDGIWRKPEKAYGSGLWCGIVDYERTNTHR